MHRMKRLLLISVMLCSMCAVFVVTAGIASAAPARALHGRSYKYYEDNSQNNSLNASTNVTANGNGGNVQVQGSTNNLTNTFDTSNDNSTD